MIIRNFPLFDTEVLYRNIARRECPLYFFQRPMGVQFEGIPVTKQSYDTNLAMGGCLPQPIVFHSRGFFISLDFNSAAPDVAAAVLKLLKTARLSVFTGWLEKQPVVELESVPVHPMSILQPCPDQHLQLWCVADPHVSLSEFPMMVTNAACITAHVEWPRVANDPGLEAPVRLRLVVVGDLFAPDGYWRV